MKLRCWACRGKLIRDEDGCLACLICGRPYLVASPLVRQRPAPVVRLQGNLTELGGDEPSEYPVRGHVVDGGLRWWTLWRVGYWLGR